MLRCSPAGLDNKAAAANRRSVIYSSAKRPSSVNVQNIEMPFAPYDRAMLDACFLCRS